MPSYEAHGGTDVWHDRSWLMANLLRGHHDPLARASEIALNQLNVDQAMQQRDEALNLRDIHDEANLRRQLAHDASTETYRQLTHDRDTEIDEQGHQMLQTMLRLDGALRRKEINKDQYDTALLDAGEQFPLGLRHPEASKHYQFAVTEADRQNDFNARRSFAEAARLGAKYGIGVQSDPETGLPSVEHTRQAAMQTDKGKQEVITGLNKELLAKYGLPTGVSSIFNPVVPHSSDDEGKTINLPFLDQKTGATSKITVPMQTFEQVKADLGPRYFQVNPTPATQPAGAVQSTSQTAAPASIPEITSPEHYQSLPPGSTFLSGGKRYQKPAEQAQ